MGELTVVESVTLDGVMQAPGRADEDTRDGFEHGGWAVPYADEVMGRAMGERMGGPGGILLGRRTYEDLFGFWPKQRDNPYTETLNRTRKYVASRSLSEPLPWENSMLIEGDAVDTVAGLKDQEDHLTVIGSGELVRPLIGRGLIDEYLLLIHPLVLGSGRRLFADGTAASLELQDTLVTTTGVVIATYRPAR
ncbi:MAG TPA: dihydrofolate reductase family protein [Solirubrobacterales bacterium]